MIKYKKVVQRVYKCPECNEEVLRVPSFVPIAKGKQEVTCPNGHKVLIPLFLESHRVE